MIIGSISENKNIEKRISITPEISKKYISSGFKVKIEKGIAEHIGIKDEEFVKEGCSLDTRENILKESDILLQMNLPTEENLKHLKEKNLLIGNFNINNNQDIINKFKKKIINFFFGNVAKDNPGSIYGYFIFASKLSWL